MKAVEQGEAREDEDAAHQNGADDSPEKHAALQVRGNLEEAEDEQEDEEIVDAHHLFDEVAGDEVGGESAVCGERRAGDVVSVEKEEDGEGSSERDRELP